MQHSHKLNLTVSESSDHRMDFSQTKIHDLRPGTTVRLLRNTG